MWNRTTVTKGVVQETVISLEEDMVTVARAMIGHRRKGGHSRIWRDGLRERLEQMDLTDGDAHDKVQNSNCRLFTRIRRGQIRRCRY